MHDEYKQLALPQGTILEPCPVCSNANPELWQYSKTETDPTEKVVMCPHDTIIGPQDGMVNEGCLLYMPPDIFYRSTIRDAIRYWNEFAVALRALRAGNDPTL